MAHKQVVTVPNIREMLRPCEKLGDQSSYTYFIYDIDQNPISYSYTIKKNATGYQYPMPCMLPNGLRESIKALQPTFDKLGFEPVAFVYVRVQGALWAYAFDNRQTLGYDLRKHEDLDLRLPKLDQESIQSEKGTFIRMYKFILRDKWKKGKAKKTTAMPYYLLAPDTDTSFSYIAQNAALRKRFFLTLQNMRLNQK